MKALKNIGILTAWTSLCMLIFYSCIKAVEGGMVG